jgi:hypothetical protein
MQFPSLRSAADRIAFAGGSATARREIVYHPLVKFLLDERQRSPRAGPKARVVTLCER